MRRLRPGRERRDQRFALPASTRVARETSAGLSEDFPLADLNSMIGTRRIADGADEVHPGTIAKAELGKYFARAP